MIDLHSHSTTSDGQLSPSDLVKHAKKEEVTTLALTDHDSCDGIEEASITAKKLGMTLIPGIEIDVVHPSGGFHLLGLGVWHYKKSLTEIQTILLEKRNQRNKRIIEKLQQLGMSIDYDDVKSHAKGHVIGRPHIAQAILQAGFAKNWEDVFARFLGTGAQAYVSKEGIGLKEAIERIHLAGGYAIVAHPQTLGLTHLKLEKQIVDWKKLGLDGIEIYHSSFSDTDHVRLKNLQEEKDLVPSGGSDFHGIEFGTARLGHSLKSGIKIPDEIAEPFLEPRSK